MGVGGRYVTPKHRGLCRGKNLHVHRKSSEGHRYKLLASKHMLDSWERDTRSWQKRAKETEVGTSCVHDIHVSCCYTIWVYVQTPMGMEYGTAQSNDLRYSSNHKPLWGLGSLV